MIRTRSLVTASLTLATILTAATALAALTPEQVCQTGRAKAAGAYAQCAQKALAKYNQTEDLAIFSKAAGKCVAKYDATWTKLGVKSPGTSCANPRFDASVAGTVIDRLTGLQWELKSNLDGVQNIPNPHDADNVYIYGTVGDNDANNTLFTSFLSTLNGACFAGQCDWRLPSRDELLAIALPAYPACAAPGPCIDPIFGPTIPGVSSAYASSSTNQIHPTNSWYVLFNDASVLDLFKSGYFVYARAVRDGV
jgi:hypothetical protein